jgi:exodeoxyribonuclease VII small subunit
MPEDAGPPPQPAAHDENADVAALAYEQAREELVDIVARLENGQAGLEESMRLWERGEALAAHCARWLDRAEERLAGTDD